LLGGENKMETKTSFQIHKKYEKEYSSYHNHQQTLKEFEEEKWKRWVAVEDITKQLKDIIDSIPRHSCDIDSSIIGDLIKELENAK